MSAPVPLEPSEITLDLLCLLAKLTPGRREAWVDTYIVGVPSERLRVSPAAVSFANQHLRRVLVTSERLREYA